MKQLVLEFESGVTRPALTEGLLTFPVITAGTPLDKKEKQMNVIALDQEDKTLVGTIDGETFFQADKQNFDWLPDGGGHVVADGNAFGVRNELSASQFCFENEADREAFVQYLESRGYVVRSIANHLAYPIRLRYGYEPKDAALALWKYAKEQLSHGGRFDTGHRPRTSQGDISFGVRALVERDFLRLQNSGGYNSPFIADVVEIAFGSLSKEDRSFFDLNKTWPKNTPQDWTPLELLGSARRISAVAACVYNLDGTLRLGPDGPLGTNFIVRNVIGLNGAMKGTGDKAAGNPMRAALRCIGARSISPVNGVIPELKTNGKKVRKQDLVNPAERTHMDKLVRTMIKAFRAHGPIRPAF